MASFKTNRLESLLEIEKDIIDHKYEFNDYRYVSYHNKMSLKSKGGREGPRALMLEVESELEASDTDADFELDPAPAKSNYDDFL
jgi:hypothetical protein